MSERLPGMEDVIPASEQIVDVAPIGGAAEPDRIVFCRQLLVLHTTWSNRRIASEAGVDGKTVEKIRCELENAHVLQRPEYLEGKDGRTWTTHEKEIESDRRKLAVVPLAEVDAEGVEQTRRALMVAMRPRLGARPDELYLKSVNPASESVRRDQLNCLARLFSGRAITHKEFGWEAINSLQAVNILRSVVQRSDYANATKQGAWQAFKGVLEQSRMLDYITEAEWQKIQIFIRKPMNLPIEPHGSIGREVYPEEWIQIADKIDLSRPEGWMALALLACLYPLGARKSDVLYYEPASLDLATHTFKSFRKKTGHDWPKVLHSLPGTEAVLAKWISLVPKDSPSIWFQRDNRGAILWDKPWPPASPGGAAEAAIGHWITGFAQRAGVPDFTPHCGHRTFENVMSDTEVKMDHWKAQGGWGRLGHVADDAYAKLTIKKREHDFDHVPEMQLVDQFYARLVREQGGKVRHVNIPIVMRRSCELPGCHNLIEAGARSDRRYCSNAHRMAATRQAVRGSAHKGKK